MDKHLLWIARVLALLGTVLCIAAVVARLSGSYVIASFQVGTILLGGMAATLIACLAYLVVLVEAKPR